MYIDMNKNKRLLFQGRYCGLDVEDWILRHELGL